MKSDNQPVCMSCYNAPSEVGLCDSLKPVTEKGMAFFYCIRKLLRSDQSAHWQLWAAYW